MIWRVMRRKRGVVVLCVLFLPIFKHTVQYRLSRRSNVHEPVTSSSKEESDWERIIGWKDRETSATGVVSSKSRDK